jgi:hypothetical protein
LHISYGNTYGVNSNIDIQVGIVPLTGPLEPDIDIVSNGLGAAESTSSTTTMITAGKLYNYNFTISNTSTKLLSNILLTLSPESGSIKILKESKWTIKNMNPGYHQEFSTQIFAPTSLIGQSTTFTLNFQYLSENQTKTGSITIGAYVDGEINIKAYDIGITYIGGIPNLTGNLLNEGNTKSLFTTIQLMGATGLVQDDNNTTSQQQYLGDLDENSPLPFSIPIQIKDGAIAGTDYPVSIRVTYKDNLRELNTFDINSKVRFEPEQKESLLAESQQSNTMATILSSTWTKIAVIATIAIVIVSVVISFRRMKNKKSRFIHSITQSKNRDAHSDIDSLLDNHSLKKADERK